MAKFICKYLLLFTLTSSFSQSTKNISKTLIGKWTIEKIDITIDNKKELQSISDTSYYVFKSDSTYTLFGTDLWGKSKIVGKWQPIGNNKIRLHDIVSRRDAKGTLIKSDNGYEIELKKINNKNILFISSYDKELEWLHELYYKKD